MGPACRAPLHWAVCALLLSTGLRAFAEVEISGGTLRPTAGCAVEFVPEAELNRSAPAALPAAGGAMHSPSEVQIWANRARGRDPDSPRSVQQVERADWARIQSNAARFIEAGGEPAVTVLDAGVLRWTHGTLARDAAFAFLISGDEGLSKAVQAHLLAQAANPFNDLRALCVRPLSGPVRDAWFSEAGWLLRHAVAYDYVRLGMSESDRVVIDNWLRRNAYALAAQLDWGLAQVFPRRSQGDMSVRNGPAAAQGEKRWLMRRYDTNKDCRTEVDDDQRVFPVTAYSKPNGSAGPTLSLLSQYYNNRRAALAAAIGTIGVMLGDKPLVSRARRYFEEWLAYGVWPDGSEGEFARNGDYCIASQGLVYGASNSTAMVLVAWALARQGDATLFEYSTRSGLFGSESGSSGSEPKSLTLVANTLMKLRTGELQWFEFEPWRKQQLPRDQTRLGERRSRYMGTGNEVENFHELGLWLAAPYIHLSGLQTMLVDRIDEIGSAPSARKVVTGFGTLTDPFNALPSVVLLRP